MSQRLHPKFLSFFFKSKKRKLNDFIGQYDIGQKYICRTDKNDKNICEKENKKKLTFQRRYFVR